MPDCLNIDANVPRGISFLGSGTMTILVPFRNFLWLPFCEIKVKPFSFSILIISLDDSRLRMNDIISQEGFANFMIFSVIILALKI